MRIFRLESLFNQGHKTLSLTKRVNVSTTRLIRDVEELTKYIRNPEHIKELNESAEYIKQEWQKLGLKVYEDIFLIDGREFKNLRVSFGPSSGERFIIGAHYDVFGNQPGADDNASGVAGLLELTRRLVENKVQPKTPLDLIAYTLEERPYCLRGSKEHAESLKKNGVKVKGMLSLEMIGYFSSEAGSQQYPIKLLNLIYPNKGNFIALVGYGNSFGLIRKASSAIRSRGCMSTRSLWLPWKILDDLGRSDHGSYSDLGYSAAMVTNTANFRNPNYHKPSDDISTISFDKMAQVIEGIYELVASL